MKPDTALLKELKILAQEKPPYNDKLVSRMAMCVKQASVLYEKNLESVRLMEAELARMKNALKKGPKRETKRNSDIVTAYKQGYTYVQLGKKYKISSQRAHAIVQAAKQQGAY